MNGFESFLMGIVLACFFVNLVISAEKAARGSFVTILFWLLIFTTSIVGAFLSGFCVFEFLMLKFS
jgi:hypothetical protein